MDHEDDGLIQSINIILIGKTGVGKSSTGNTILGEEYFKPGHGFLSETLECEWRQQTRNGIEVTVVDTPGIFHSHLSDEEVKQEIAENIAIMTPGPNVLLMVVKGNDRFTQVEEMVYSQLKEIFGQEFTRHVIVVFTGLDSLKIDASDLEKIVYKSSPALHQMVVESGERAVVLNNYAEKQERERQANQLVDCCVKLVRANKGNCYSSEHLNTFTKKINSEENPTSLVGRIYSYWFTPSTTIRIVLIGKTGVGKSATGNTILGENCFATVTGLSSETKSCGRKYIIKDGMEIQMCINTVKLNWEIIHEGILPRLTKVAHILQIENKPAKDSDKVTDTPGVCDTHRPKEEIRHEIAKVIASMTPGPHALLFIVKGNCCFTKEEKKAYEELKNIFGQDIKHYMIVVFTGMDELTETQLKLEIDRAPEDLKTVLVEANNRCVWVNNTASREDRDVQAKELLTRVKKLIAANRGNYYSTHLMKKIEVELQKMVTESGKTQNEIIHDIVYNTNSSFSNRLIYLLMLLHPKQLCRIM